MEITTLQDAIYIQIRKGRVRRTIEIGDDGVAWADYDRKKRLLGIEILNQSHEEKPNGQEGDKTSQGR